MKWSFGVKRHAVPPGMSPGNWTALEQNGSQYSQSRRKFCRLESALGSLLISEVEGTASVQQETYTCMHNKTSVKEMYGDVGIAEQQK